MLENSSWICYNEKGVIAMSKIYTFEFPGTKSDFFRTLDTYPHNTSYSGDKFYYFHDVIVKTTDGTLHIGVERGGHSGGYWFIPTITEHDDRLIFCGSIQYIGPEGVRNGFQKTLDRIGDFLLFILLLPLILLIRLYLLMDWVVKKLSHTQKPVVPTTEQRLFDLMENHLGCVRK